MLLLRLVALGLLCLASVSSHKIATIMHETNNELFEKFSRAYQRNCDNLTNSLNL